MPDDLARCDQEIAEILARPDVIAGRAPAWLVVFGVNDWTVERDLIERDFRQLGEQKPRSPSRKGFLGLYMALQSSQRRLGSLAHSGLKPVRCFGRDGVMAENRMTCVLSSCQLQRTHVQKAGWAVNQGTVTSGRSFNA